MQKLSFFKGFLFVAKLQLPIHFERFFYNIRLQRYDYKNNVSIRKQQQQQMLADTSSSCCWFCIGCFYLFDVGVEEKMGNKFSTLSANINYNATTSHCCCCQSCCCSSCYCPPVCLTLVEEFSTEEKKEKLCFLFRPFKQTIFLNRQTETNEQTNKATENEGKRKNSDKT